MKLPLRHRKWSVVLLVGLLLWVITGSAIAAEFAGNEEVYRLAAGEVVNDDLYVGSGEVYIDGTVKGDLFVFGGYIEINGVVEGDLFAVGGGVVIRGQVMDDARIAGAGLEISGQVGDDLFAAGGGGQAMAVPMQFGVRSIPQGVRLEPGAEVGGDAVIAGGGGRIAGRIAGDLMAGMGTLELAGQVGGDADLQVASLRVDEESRVGGILRYSSPDESNIPGEVSGTIRYEAPQAAEEAAAGLVGQIVGWFVRTLLILAGFALLGWLLLRFAPGLLTTPAAAIQERPLESGIYGLLAGVLLIFIPILSVLLVVLMWIFWGTFPALAMAAFLFASLALVWLFSPLITGLWLGQLVVERAGRTLSLTGALLVGVLLIALIGRIPIVGWLVYLVSFALALGGVLRARRAAGAEQALLPTEAV